MAGPKKPASKGTVVHEVTLLGKFAERLGGKRTIKFVRGINILCGANGSGKSTVLDAIASAGGPNGADRKQVAIKVDPGRTLRHDFEKDNPRVKSWGAAAIDGQRQLANVIYSSREMSHGQWTRRTIQGLAGPEMTDHLVMLDEPEQALDLCGLHDLRSALLESKASQIIIATHAPMLILDPVFNVVEMTPGYRERVGEAVYRWEQRMFALQQPSVPPAPPEPPAKGRRRRST